jgi:hypothetical protein
MNENKFLKDFFTKKYADSIGDSNFYIAFEDCGFHISKESFTDEISKQYSENVQVEHLSHDCDCVVPIGDTIMAHSASTISDCIELLKDTIKFNDKKFAADAETMLPVFGNAKNKLTGLFVSTASTLDSRSSFYQSNLNPANFLDDSNTSLWTPYNESWSFPSTATDNSQPQNTDSTNSIWKIRPALFQNLQMLKTEALVQPVTSPATETMVVELRPHMVERGPAMKRKVRSHLAMASIPAATITATPALSTMPAQPVASALVNKRAASFLTANAFLADSTFASRTENNSSKALLHSNLAGRDLMVQRFIVSNDAGKKEDTPLKTSNVNISFQYCIVHILRPWLYKNIFDISQTWYCVGLGEGFFSTGETTTANNGKLPSLPVSMILIKDLSISATFNAGDWESAKNAVALDSLNIAEADFKDLGDNKHVIESKGVQIIGWICEYIPKLPVCSDPNLITP